MLFDVSNRSSRLENKTLIFVRKVIELFDIHLHKDTQNNFCVRTM
jgi:hypothetical protein